MQTKARIRLLSMAVLLLIIPRVSARSIYVSSRGSDDNPGTPFYPFATLQKAADTARPGDSVYVLEGYYKQKVAIKDIKATKDNPVLFKALGEVIIDGPADVTMAGALPRIGDFNVPISDPEHLYYPYYRGAIVRVDNCTGVIIDGFNIRNSPWFGLGALACENLTIRGCIIEDTTSSAMYLLNCKDLIVAFNEVMRACSYPGRIASHGAQESISVVNCERFELMYNRVHESGTWNNIEGSNSGTGGEGIDAKESSHDGSIHHNYIYNLSRQGLYIDAWNSSVCGNIDVYSNVVHDTQHGLAIAGEAGGTVKNIRVFNNLFYNHWLQGLVLASWYKGGHKDNIQIFNNTIFRSTNDGIELGSDLHTNMSVVNNIIFRCGRRGGTGGFNLGKAQIARNEGNLTGVDPCFVNTKVGDFRLSQGSPAIDAGVEVNGCDRDLFDAPRIVGKAIDIGALEHGSQPATPCVIFVSTRGSDDNQGTLFKPYATIQKAADTVGAGDTVCVLAGYYKQKVAIKNVKASKDKPVVFTALGKVVINGPNDIFVENPLPTIHSDSTPISNPKHLYYPYYRGAVVRLDNCTNVTFAGFEVQNSPWFGIAALNCQGLTIQGCKTHDTMASGIYVLESKGVTVGYNEVIRACGSDRRTETHGSQESISMVNCVGFEVMYNRVHEPATYSRPEGGTGVGGEGIDAKEHSQNGSIHHNYVYNLGRPGIYVDAWNSLDLENVKIYNNIVHDCFNGMAVGAEDGGTVTGLDIHGNLFYNNRGSGIVLFSWGRNGIKKDIRIYGNTICYNEGTGIAMGTETSENIQIFNNLAIRNGKNDFSAGTARNVTEGGNIFGKNPKLVDAERSDFRLLPESPAIDAAVEYTVPTIDLDDRPRVSGKAMDVGCFEHGK
jgi:hypothetical protein